MFTQAMQAAGLYTQLSSTLFNGTILFPSDTASAGAAWMRCASAAATSCGP